MAKIRIKKMKKINKKEVIIFMNKHRVEMKHMLIMNNMKKVKSIFKIPLSIMMMKRSKMKMKIVPNKINHLRLKLLQMIKII